MAKIFQFFIRLYWRYIPQENRIICIYSESCSQYVYRKFQEVGTFSGIKALAHRFKNCRHGYSIIYDGNKINLKTKNHSLLTEEEISNTILHSYKITNDIS